MKKLSNILLSAVLATALAACGSSGSSSSGTGSALKGLATCTTSAGEAVICGQVLAADGVTPVVGAEIRIGDASADTSAPFKSLEKGTASDTKCETDASGNFACSGITSSGTFTFYITATGVSKSFSSATTLDATTSVPVTSTTLSSTDETSKYLVVPGSWDGVQLLLSQLKSCTLTGSSSSPPTMTASTDCTSKGLTVLTSDEIATTFSALANLTQYASIFINCGTDMTDYATVIQAYVAQGGNIYFSDLADPGLTAAFPDKVTFGTNSTSTGTITATVAYANLATYLGSSTMSVAFDLGGWQTVSSVASGITTYVSGNTSSLGGTAAAPITVGWKQGTGGCVYYTSYHIEGAPTGSDQEKALKYLILNVASVCQ